mmetsp:Transcript_21209/g.35005  ORF Transcript_21209/g.35005 Transcript_21209/m.35005 type:complete len:218 (-) Transcript_21209:1150-1803(-)
MCREARVAGSIDPREGQRPTSPLMLELRDHLNVCFFVRVLRAAIEHDDRTEPALVSTFLIEVSFRQLDERGRNSLTGLGLLCGCPFSLPLLSFTRLSQLHQSLVDEIADELRNVPVRELPVHLWGELHSLQLHLLSRLHVSFPWEHDDQRRCFFHVEPFHKLSLCRQLCKRNLPVELHRDGAENGRHLALFGEEETDRLGLRRAECTTHPLVYLHHR